MRTLSAVLLCLALGTSACNSTSYSQEGPTGIRNMWAGDHIRDASLREAVLSQRTLYPYHFVVGAAELNELGWRDMEMLAAHFALHGGELSVRRGDADEELYGERMRAVELALAAAGVEPGRVRLSDALPGGAGITAERMLEVLERSHSELSTEDASPRSGSAGSSTRGGAAAGSTR
jgi:hypothetical protein